MSIHSLSVLSIVEHGERIQLPIWWNLLSSVKIPSNLYIGRLLRHPILVVVRKLFFSCHLLII